MKQQHFSSGDNVGGNKLITNNINLNIKVWAILLTIIMILSFTYFSIDRNSRKKIPLFEGIVREDSLNEEFDDFIFENESKIVELNISWENGLEEVNEEGYDYYYGTNTCEYLIEVEKESDFYYDSRIWYFLMKGYFKIVGISGPRQGIYSVYMKPVKIEAVY